jgi:3-oxoadipate enol-lactonase
MTLASRIDGPPGAPLLVLSGGLGTTTSVWDAQLPGLTEHFRLLRFDLPGHGASPVPAGPVSVAGIGRAVLGLLDDLEAARVSFCGLSLGGMIGLWLGANATDRVDRLVLACTGASLGTREGYAERAAAVRAGGVGTTVDGARERWFTPAFRDSAEARRILDELRTISTEGYAACAEAVGEFDFHAELGAIRPPTLVVHGEDDPVTPPAVVDALVDGIPGARRCAIAHAAHLANVEQPDAFTAAVLSHLEQKAAA